MKRRRFLRGAGSALVATGATAVAGAPSVIAQPQFRWRMVPSFSPSVEILYAGAQRFATVVEELTGGRLKIQVFAPQELVPAGTEFDACSRGEIEMLNSAAFFWRGREPAFPWFTAVPFGLNAQATYAWFYAGDGLKLWEEAYAPFGLTPRPGGSTGVQMGGWFRRKVSQLADFKGLKLRMPGLGGRV
ncbi:MAG: ABC transporter substrate-binding protein, partial [Candidatus Rokuibacteriota bacterium]